MREDYQNAAERYHDLGNKGAEAVCVSIVARLDGFQKRLARIEAKYYARSLLTQGRKKAPADGHPTGAESAPNESRSTHSSTAG